MDFKTICLIIISIGICGILGSIVFLKVNKLMHEKSLAYGIFAALLVILFSNFVVVSSDLFYLIIDSLFLSMLFYNFVNMFGFKMAQIQNDEKMVISFFIGIGIIGNLISFMFLGIGGISLGSVASNPILLEYFDQSLISALSAAYQSTIMNYGYLLVVSLIVAILIDYMTIKMFVYAIVHNTAKTVFKALFMLFAFHIINLYTPSSSYEGIIVLISYGAVLLASYMLYKESKKDKQTLKIIIK